MALRMVPRAAPVPRGAARAATQRSALRGAPLRHAAAPRASHRAPAQPRAELLQLAPRSNPLLTARGQNGAPLAVLDTEGRSVTFAELTAGKTVVSFIRHFGFRLAIVGVGLPASAKKFARLLNPPLSEDVIFVDPTRQSYEALGLYKGLARTFLNAATPKAIQERGLDALKAATKNYEMIPPPKPDDALQQGGLLVVNGAQVLYAWRDEGTADHAPIAQILAACAAA